MSRAAAAAVVLAWAAGLCSGAFSLFPSRKASGHTRKKQEPHKKIAPCFNEAEDVGEEDAEQDAMVHFEDAGHLAGGDEAEAVLPRHTHGAGRRKLEKGDVVTGVVGERQEAGWLVRLEGQRTAFLRGRAQSLAKGQEVTTKVVRVGPASKVRVALVHGRISPANLTVGDRLLATVQRRAPHDKFLVDVGAKRLGLVLPGLEGAPAWEVGEAVNVYYGMSQGRTLLLSHSPLRYNVSGLELGQRLVGRVSRKIPDMVFVAVGAERDAGLHPEWARNLSVGDEAEFVVSNKREGGEFEVVPAWLSGSETAVRMQLQPGDELTGTVLQPGRKRTHRVLLPGGRLGSLHKVMKWIEPGEEVRVVVTEIESGRILLEKVPDPGKITLAEIAVGRRLPGKILGSMPKVGFLVDMGLDQHALLREEVAGDLAVGDERDFDVVSIGKDYYGNPAIDVVDSSVVGADWRDLELMQRLEARVVKKPRKGLVLVDVGTRTPHKAIQTQRAPPPLPVGREIPVWVMFKNDFFIRFSTSEVARPFQEVCPGMMMRGRVVKQAAEFLLVDVGVGVDAMLHRDYVDLPNTTGSLCDGEEIDVWATDVDHELFQLSVTMREPAPRAALELGQEVEGVVIWKDSSGMGLDLGGGRTGYCPLGDSRDPPALNSRVPVVLTGRDPAMADVDFLVSAVSTHSLVAELLQS